MPPDWSRPTRYSSLCSRVQEISVEAGEKANVSANLRPVTTTPAETPTANALSLKPNDIVVESSTPSVKQEFAASQTENEAKPVPVGNSSASGSGGWIGLTGITGAYGVIITELASDGPARGAGLKIADTIIAVDDTSVKTMQIMDGVTNPRAPGSQMKISYIRNGIASETIVTVQRHH
jgi:C-terminal processing protease CtpA/Prc